ncbi:MAG: DUF402 domain-containing protein [Thermoflavifilum sp.]|nr:DUF402 domain-containing protein [Thermoflavifilum sp.]MCL6514179.1 DUF402 domain-containing protein [Alicyclobacillus sp.]
MAETLTLASIHADGTAHRRWPQVLPTPDPWTFLIPTGWPVVEADGRQWASDHPVLAVFWPDRWYQLFVLLKRNTTGFYCNIIRPPVYHPETRMVEFVDLDLDVLVDDEVRLVDVEEFEARSGVYPVAWRAAAWAAADELVQLARDRTGPFHPAAVRRWRAFAARA